MIDIYSTKMTGVDGNVYKVEYTAEYSTGGPYKTLYVSADSLKTLKDKLMKDAEGEIDMAFNALLNNATTV